ncbi:MAG: T9SS type A sorting domain-containing protein [Bacteroidetes bacterium]|nr:T9SS type A sorting domain-containing protein [Bacteroidota bacterium]
MKKIIFTLISLVTLENTAFSQWMADSVLMGTGSVNDVYFSMQNGTVKTVDSKDWHLAFSMSPGDSASIWANHNAGNSYVKVYNIHKSVADWSTVTLADTATARMGYNNDKGWFQGALNDLPRASIFSFGWGTYDLTSHNIYGDSMFIIKANNIFYKVAIDSLKSIPMEYYFRIEDLTTPGAMIVDTIKKGTTYPNNIFAYYNLATAADSVREPASANWELVFNRYNSFVDMGTGPVPYPVIGALSNKGVKVSKANGDHVDTAFLYFGTYVMPWPADSNKISAVGYDWKSFTPPGGPWVVPDSVSYFIHDKAGSLYQLQFTGYNGSGPGVIYLRRRLVVPTSVNDIESNISQYEIFPNPAQAHVNLMLESKENTSANLMITNLHGQVVMQQKVSLSQGLNNYQLNVSGLSAGNYILSLNGTQIAIREKLSIAK